jgi:hypothetical protein
MSDTARQLHPITFFDEVEPVGYSRGVGFGEDPTDSDLATLEAAVEETGEVDPAADLLVEDPQHPRPSPDDPNDSVGKGSGTPAKD